MMGQVKPLRSLLHTLTIFRLGSACLAYQRMRFSSTPLIQLPRSLPMPHLLLSDRLLRRE